MNDIYTSIDEEKNANKNALLFARSKYMRLIDPFVKGSSDRLAFAQNDIDKIIAESVGRFNASQEYVSRHLMASIQDDLEKMAKPEAVTDPKKEKVEFKTDKGQLEKGIGGGPETPSSKIIDPSKRPDDSIEKTDISYHNGPVLEDEIREADKVHNLKSDTMKWTKVNEQVLTYADYDKSSSCCSAGCTDCSCGGSCGGDCPCKKKVANDTSFLNPDEIKNTGIPTYDQNSGEKPFDLAGLTTCENCGNSSEVSIWFNEQGGQFSPESCPSCSAPWTMEEVAGNFYNTPIPALSCVRCSTKTSSVVCDSCNNDLIKKADALNGPQQVSPIQPQNAPPALPANFCPTCGAQVNIPGTTGSCSNCGTQLGTQQVNPPASAQIGQPAAPTGTPGIGGVMQNTFMPQASKKVAQMPGEDIPQAAAPGLSQPTPAPMPTAPKPGEDVEVGQGLTDTPRERFNDVTENLANRAAAKQFSIASDEIIQAIAQQTGVDPEQVRSALQVEARFGEEVAINGNLGGQIDPEAFTEITLDNHSPEIEGQQAQVPLQMAINTVSQELGTDPDFLLKQIVDSFGGQQLPEEYTVPLTGSHKFYLPIELAGAQQQLPEPQESPINQQPENPSDIMDQTENPYPTNGLNSQPAH
jgi:hypothetical protein